MKRFCKSFRKCLPVYYVAVTILPCIALGVMMFTLFYRQSAKDIASEMDEKSRLQAGYVASFVEEAEATARFTAQIQPVRQLLLDQSNAEQIEAVEGYLLHKKEMLGYIEHSFVMNEKRQVLADSNSATDALVIRNYEAQLFDAVDQGAAHSLSIAVDSADEHHLYLSVPIEGEGGIIGYVVEKLNPSYFEEFVAHFANYEGSFAFLLDESGQMISREFTEILTDTQNRSYLTDIAQQSKDLFTNDTRLESGEFTFSLDGEKYIAYYRWVPGYPVMLASALPQRVSGLLVAKQLWLIAGISLLFSLAALYAGLNLSRRVTNPLDRLFESIHIGPTNENINEFEQIANSFVGLEEELENCESALFAEKNKYHGLLECCGNISFEYDVQARRFELFIPRHYTQRSAEKGRRKLLIKEEATLDTLLHPNDVLRVQNMIDRVAASPYRVISGNVRIQIYEDACTPVKARWMAVHDKDGQVAIIGSFDDYERVKKLEKNLADYQCKYNFTVQTMSDIMYEVDFEQDVLQVQEDLWYQMFDIPLIGGYQAIMRAYAQRVHINFLQDFTRLFVDLEHLLTIPDFTQTMDYQVLNKEGKYTWVRHTVFATTSKDGRVLSALGHITNVDEHKYHELEALKHARMDPLTRAYNSRYMKIQVTKGIVSFPDEPIAIMLVDIDDFSALVQKYGHLAGEELLCHVVEVLWCHQTGNNYVGRIGSDCFMLCLSGADSASADKVSEKITKDLCKNVPVEEHTIAVNASIGIALYPQHGNSYDTLLACARKALKAAKSAGKNCCCIYDPEQMKEFVIDRFEESDKINS